MAAQKQPKLRASNKPCAQTDVNPYQAVVITDNFSSTFSPLTKKNPRILMPLVNAPILEYTLTFLNTAGIQLVFLFCSRDADEIKEYIMSSHWSDASSPMEVVVIVSKSCLTMGDALRELDTRAIVRNDFVLLTGDLVANVKLRHIIDDHRERYKKDKQLVMTMLYKRAFPRHRTRCPEEETVLVVDHATKRILYHQKVGSCKKIAMPLSIFQENSKVDIRHDVLDCQIAICSPQVLPLFTDNFDFQTRDDFVKGLLVDEEILGNSILFHELNDEYAARVSNFHMYDAVSKDVIGRWVYPFVPDTDLFNTKVPYSYLRHNVYLQKDVTLARSCVIKENVVIGTGTQIGADSVIENSVIGRNCVIGDNVTISNAYVWNDVVIEDKCQVKSAILASKVRLLKNVRVAEGCILCSDVVIGPSANLPQKTLLTDEFYSEDDFEDEPKLQSKSIDKALVGPKGKAYRFQGDDEDAKDYFRYLSRQDIQSEEDDVSDSEVSDAEAESDEDGLLVDDTKSFYKEVVDSVVRAANENVSCENLVLEINSSKYAYNVTMKEVNMLVTMAVMETPTIIEKKELEPADYFKVLKPVLTQFIPVFKNYLKSIDSQTDCLNALEDYSSSHSNFVPNFMKILNLMYKEEILLEDAILKWYSQPLPSENPSNYKVIRKQVQPFITWLQEAEEESDEESD